MRINSGMQKFIFLFIFFVVNLGFFNFVFAECRPLTNVSCVRQSEENCSSPCEWYDTGGDTTQDVSLSNPLGTSDPNVLIGKIINAVLGIVGSIALAMFIFGGFTWMTAAGGSEKVQKGKDTLVWATIGLIVIFTAYAVVRFVLDGLAGTIP